MASQRRKDAKEKPIIVKTENGYDIVKDLEEPYSEKDDDRIPNDKFYMIYFLFFFLGLVHKLPWTFFTTATKYWMYKFRNTTINDTSSELRTDLQATFNASVNLTMQISEIVFLMLSMVFVRFIKVRTRMIGVLTVTLTLFSVVTAFVNVDTDSWQVGFFAITMAIMLCINAMSAVLTVTMFTILSNFPHNYLAPYIVGGGLARFVNAVLQIISLALAVSTVNSAFIYFGMGIFLNAFTLLAFAATSANPYYSHHMKKYQEDQLEKMVTFTEAKRLLKKIWSSVVMTGLFLVTEDASPTALVVSEGEGNGRWNDVYFIPTITYLLPSVCDQIGRNLAFRWIPNLSGVTWTLFAVSRFFIFVPLFIFCNAQPRHHLPVLLPHDYQYIIIMIIYSISDGYIISLCTYRISRLVTKEELKNAYHVNMLCGSLQLASLSWAGMVSVKLL